MLGFEGWGGIYVTLPEGGIHATNFDIGVFGTGGLSAGWNIGFNNQYGIIKGNESDIQGITVNANVAAGPGSVTASFDREGNLVGAMVGPSAELGASVTLSETHAIGLNDFGTWLGGWIYEHTNHCP